MTLHQVAAHFQVHPNTIRREIKDGKLEGVRWGRVTIITEAALAAYAQWAVLSLVSRQTVCRATRARPVPDDPAGDPGP